MRAIEASDLRKAYKGGVVALDGLSFEVEAGTIFGLLGPNGAGKSTTVKILTTLSRADTARRASPVSTSSATPTASDGRSASSASGRASIPRRPAGRTSRCRPSSTGSSAPSGASG